MLEWSAGGDEAEARRTANEAAPIPIPERDASRSQATASDPRNSAWVSANAGSGKTHVLTQRVIRLLLAGTDPSKILCLTYTRPRPPNMSNRVFAALSEWTMLPDDELAQQDRGDRGRASRTSTSWRGRAGCSPRRWKRRAG